MTTHNLNSSTKECEDKWHQTLNTTFSIFFWNKTWEALKKSVVNNKIKWFMLQTNRFILPTNYTVNKYNPSQDPQCSFCAQHPEKLEMLLWGCQIVREFWTVVENILKDLFQDFILTQKEAIFLSSKHDSDTAVHTVLLLSRYYIWRQKFLDKKLDTSAYKNYMKTELWYCFNSIKIKLSGKVIPNDWGPILEYFKVEVVNIWDYEVNNYIL